MTHFVFRQAFDGVEVLNAVWTVNLDREGAVINAGGHLVKRPAGASPAWESGPAAVRAAVLSINPTLDGSYLAAPQSKGEKFLRFSRGGIGKPLEGRPGWFETAGAVRPAWLIAVPGENGIDRYATVVDAAGGRILRQENLTRFQAPQPPARGLVFERESPQPNPTPGRITGPRPYVERTVQPLTGDPVASPRGWVNGTRTVGNNVIAGTNPLGESQIQDPVTAEAPDRNFSFPLQLGPGAPNPTNFREAAVTNLFYWLNRAHDRFYGLGFDEAAGNFQQDNFGRGGVGGDPMLAYSQFGIAAPQIAAIDNAFYTSNRPFEDGSRPSVNMYLANTAGERFLTDGSYDAEVMVHEYTHGVSDRLANEVYATFQGRAMGEAWSDFFGLEFTVPEGAPPDGAYVLGEYFFQDWGTGIRTRPYATDRTVNPLTFANYGRIFSRGPEEHADGEIWMSALWDARASLIAQLGEKEGRRRMALLVLDGMKLMPPAASMVDARDAILLADRVDFRGEDQSALWAAFAKRGFGVMAFSATGDSNAVTASGDRPSPQGILRFEWPSYSMGEQVRLILHDANAGGETARIQLTTSSGDVENLVLRRRGETYYGTIPMGTDGHQDRFDSYLDVLAGDYLSAYYVDYDTGGGSARLIETTVTSAAGYSFTPQTGPVQTPPTAIGRSEPLFNTATGAQFFTYVQRTLPFPFPFFGRSYRTLWIGADGYVSFDVPPNSFCNDAATVGETPIVAPLWVEMAYGAAQRNENVYYTTLPDSVMIRWAAETVATGEPINVSLVLFSDGRMLFQYGEGNNNLVNSPIFGCGTQTPFIGVSNGRGTLAQPFDDYTGVPSLDRAPTILVDPPFNPSSLPQVRIESPEPGGSYIGVLTVKGVAWDDNHAIARLDLLVDGVPRRVLPATLQRTDFCAAQRVSGCPFIGFSTVLDFASLRLAPGEHTVQIRATNTRGASVNYPEQPLRFTAAAGQSRAPEGRIETPADGATIGRSTVVRGWAYAPDLRVRSVDILLNGITYGQATYGQRRDDICGALPEGSRPPNCPNVGFTFTLNTAGRLELPNGESTLQIRVRDESERYTLLPEKPVRIVVAGAEPSAAPVGFLTSPAANATVSGTIKIWGWGWDPDGTIRTAQLLVDGAARMTLAYGEERSGQCPSLPDVKACPNIGFSGDFDTTILSNGLHQIGVRLTDDTGRSVIVPTGGGLGLNVFVNNP